MSRYLILLCASVAGCCNDDSACKAEFESANARPTTFVTQGTQEPAPTQDGRRITVERIGVVADSLAYGNRRGVYVIRDNKTGTEFIGVSGVGIAETGSHRSGKTSVSDER